MKEKMERTAADLLARAKQSGAQDAEVIGHHSTTTRIGFEKNDFNLGTQKSESSFALEVHRDGRRGSATTNETDADALSRAAESAVTLAGFSLPDEYLCFPEPAAIEPLPGLFDPALVEIEPAVLSGYARDFLAAVKSDQRLLIDSGEVKVDTSWRIVTNSRGLTAFDRRSTLSWVVAGQGREGEEITSFDWDGGSSFKLAGSRERMMTSASSFVEKVGRCFGARKGESYKGQVLLSPDCVAQLLLGPIGYHSSGRQVMDGKSRWADKLGEEVAVKQLSLVDDPHDVSLTGACSFDAEGVPVERRSILEEGVLRLITDSSYTARRRGTASTGHAGGMHCQKITAGSRERSDLIASSDQLLVLERFSGNIDPVSGDFSGVAKSSHYYRDGDYRHPLTETMVAGNFFEMLRSIIGASSETVAVFDSYSSPWLLVDGLSVTAG